MHLTNDIDARILALIDQKARERVRKRSYTVREAIDAALDDCRQISALLVTLKFPLVSLQEVRDELRQMLHYGVLEIVPPVDHPLPFYHRRRRRIRKKPA